MSKSADAFRTISEVADWLGVQTHVLRFWESKFTQVKPVKRAGGRRYYRPADMLLLGGIRKLLHDDGLTIKGVQKVLREEGMAYVSDMSLPLDDETAGQLDSDLVEHTGDDVKMTFDSAEVVSIADHTKARAESAETQPPAEQVQKTPSTLPSFMRGPTPSEPPQAQPPAAPQETNDPDDTAPQDTADPEQTPPASPDAAPAPSTAKAPVVNAPASETAAKPETGDPDSSAVPSERTESLQPSDLGTAGTSPADETKPHEVETEEPQEAQAAALPRPRIIDVPDENAADPDSFAPSAMTKAAQISHISANKRDALHPLLAQLTALRDQMAQAQRPPH